MPSSDSETATDEADSDNDVQRTRGRNEAQHALGNGTRRVLPPNGRSNEAVRNNARPASDSHSQSGGSRRNSPTRGSLREPFTRSRSPAMHALSGTFTLPHRTQSPAINQRARHSLLPPTRSLLPGSVNVTFRIPFTVSYWMVDIDVRQAAENCLLLVSLGYGADKLRAVAGDPFSPDMWCSIEITLLIIASIIYYSITRLAWHKVIIPPSADPPNATPPPRPASPRSIENKRGAVTASLNKKEETGFLWMTVPKNYRDAADDGILTGLLGGPLIVTALLYLTIRWSQSSDSAPLPSNWLIEEPRVLSNDSYPRTALEALLVSRRSLVSLSTFCSTILIVHVCASRITEARHRRKIRVPDGELNHVPRKEGRRAYLYILFTVSVTLWILCVKIALAESQLGIWQGLRNGEVVAASLFYQFTLYIAVRLAHHGFTLGELSLVSFGATVLFMEMMNLTIARIWSSSTPFIKTYRLPTPLLIYQIALIPGSFLVGFLLSPLLYLSRHLARRPARRLKFPEEKLRQRRLLALGFYGGTLLIVGGLIGLWARWCLGNRDPWVWVVLWLLEGRTKWARPALLAYWAALGSISVAGWNRQLARSRRYRTRPMASMTHEPVVAPATATLENVRPSTPTNSSSTNNARQPPSPGEEVQHPLGINFPNLPNLPNLPQLSNGTNVATELLDAADKRVPTLSLNARRKFFHVLAVVMFVPGVVVDPAFAHLSFGAAFALFTFAEYVRYFALYPFGAAVHVFMNEFLDQKDSGTAILSHFYLLSGCAITLWLEGSSRLLHFTGILVLGVGDALASIVGKRFGRHRWVSSVPKTIEGSAAFIVSVVVCAWTLRLCGFTEEFSIIRYGAAAVVASVLEAFSVQNDNLTLPLYMWSMLALVDV